MKKVLAFAFIVSVFSCKAQPPVATTSKKAEKEYNEAMEALGKHDWKKGIAGMEKAKKADPTFVEPYMVLGDLYDQLGQREDAIKEYLKSYELNPSFAPSSYVRCGENELRLGRYEDAKKHFEDFKHYQRGNGNPQSALKAEAGLKTCTFALNALQHPVPFNPVNMGGAINSADCEYFPAVTADDATFLFTRNRHGLFDVDGKKIDGTQEDFFVSTRKPDGTWDTARSIGPPINTERNEGAPSLSPDGQFLFFTACDVYGSYGENRTGQGDCDIFFSQKIGNKWTPPVNLGPKVNTPYWESQPSFSSDGRTLYFASARPGGSGDGDIWMARIGDDGKWGDAENLGKVVNTPGREEAVFIHPDNQTLYFASNGHPGMGGLDLFVSHRDSSGNWGAPQNLGYPINTFKNESGLIVNGLGQMAYFSSDRQGTLGCEDFYQFELPEFARPIAVSYMKGKVFDAKTKKPLRAGFELLDPSTGKTIITSLSDKVTGEFLLTVPANKNYALNVSMPGYLFYSESFLLKESTDPLKPIRKDVPLQPIAVGDSITLKNVFFETAKYDLKPESKAELQKLVNFMNTNPLLKAEIGGHTDNVGNSKDNLTLSNNRAKSVYDYLVTNGIAATRLSYKGYGDTKPIADNKTPEGRQQNRRTEFKIVAVK